MTDFRQQRVWWQLLCAAGILWSRADAFAEGTIAGTDIANTARIEYSVGVNSVTTSSNTAVVTVAEIIDVDVVLQSGQVPVGPGETNQGLVFTITNTGNGTETFTLIADSTLPGDDFDPVLLSPNPIFFDTDGSGDFSAADVAYIPGTNDPELSPDEHITVVVLNDIPASGLVDTQTGSTRLHVEAGTGVGVAGTIFVGAGDGGVDAMAGATEGDGEDTGEYMIKTIDLNVSKSAGISDPFGNALPVPGAEITYRIEVSVTGTGVASGVVMTDVIPAHTTYVPGTIELNGTQLTDAPDADVGEFNAGTDPAVAVQIGDISEAGGPQVVEFKVVIN